MEHETSISRAISRYCRDLDAISTDIAVRSQFKFGALNHAQARPADPFTSLRATLDFQVQHLYTHVGEGGFGGFRYMAVCMCSNTRLDIDRIDRTRTYLIFFDFYT